MKLITSIIVSLVTMAHAQMTIAQHVDKIQGIILKDSLYTPGNGWLYNQMVRESNFHSLTTPVGVDISGVLQVHI